MTAPAMLTDEELDETVVIEAAANIIDVMSGGDSSWRDSVAFPDCLGSTFLDSADWQMAVAYARAALVSMARRTAEAEEKLAAFETGIVPTQWFDDERVRAERAETTIAQLREQMATLRRDSHEEAAKVADAHGDKADAQIADNNAYARRVGRSSEDSEANDFCRAARYEARSIAEQIRALAATAPEPREDGR